MKTLIFSLLFLSTHFLNHAQTPTWQWAKSGGGWLAEYGWKTAADDSGNVYVTGSFDSPTLIIDNVTLTNTGYQNAFVVKFNSAGILIWVRASSSEMEMYGRSIAVDDLGGVYIGGTFRGDSVVFGTSVIYNNDPTTNDLFLLKYDSYGNEQWAVSGGGSLGEGISNITIDGNNCVFITGSYSSSVFTIGNTSFTNCDTTTISTELFLLKFNSNGVLLWGRSACGSYDDYASTLTTDIADNVYVAGNFNSTFLDFGTDTIYNGTGIIYSDYFLAKYDSTGSLIWVKSEPNSYNQSVFGIAADLQGNIYVAGTYDHPFFFIGTTLIAHYGLHDVFLARYDTAGNNVWAISGGSDDFDIPNGIDVDPSGNIIMTGTFISQVLIFGSDSLQNAGGLDIFVARFDPSGNVNWLIGAGDSLSEAPRGMTVDNNGNVIITGYFYSPSLPFGNHVVNNTFQSDFFVAKLSSTVGVAEEINNNKIILFPNPFSESITLFTGALMNDATIEIFDMQGRSVYRFAGIHGVEFRLDFLGKESGVYQLRLSDANGQQLANEKIILMEINH